MATVLVEDQCLIPGDLATLAAFRRWADVRFTIHRWEPAGYVASLTADGRCLSTVFGCGFTVVRSRNASGRFVYDLAAG